MNRNMFNGEPNMLGHIQPVNGHINTKELRTGTMSVTGSGSDRPEYEAVAVEEPVRAGKGRAENANAAGKVHRRSLLRLDLPH